MAGADGREGTERARFVERVGDVVGDLDPTLDPDELVRELGRRAAAFLGAEHVRFDDGRADVRFAGAGRALTDAERSVLDLVAGHAALAVTRASLYDAVVHRHLHERAVVNAMADGVAVLDSDGLVSTWNESAERLTGVLLLDVLGEEPPFPVGVDGEPVEHRLADGRWIESITTSLTETGERVVAFRDVTHQKELDEAKNRFLATTSHELKTPLTVISGFAATLAERWDDLPDTFRRQAVETIRRRSVSLARLIEQLLLTSKIDANALQLARERFDLLPALQTAAAGFESVSSRHTFVVELPLELPMVVGDSGTVDKILGQLLENAFKYSPDGGEVRVAVDVVDDEVRVQVLDRGIGIDIDLRDRVFDRFVQAEDGDRRRFGGVGLGLSIVRALVEGQGGRVSVTPREGGGSVFSFTLPIATVSSTLA